MNWSKRLGALLLAALLICLPLGAGQAAENTPPISQKAQSFLQKKAYEFIETGFSQEDSEKALPYFQRAARLCPQDADVLYICGIGFFTYGDLEGAESYLEKAIAIGGSNHDQILVSWASIHAEMGDISGSIDALRDALTQENDPNMLILTNLIGLLAKAKRLDEAYSLLEEKIAQNAEIPELYALRARALASENKYEAAIADCNQALKLAPDVAASYHLLYEIQVSSGQFILAERTLGKLLAVNSEDELWLDRAVLRLEKMKDENRALEDLDALIRMNPDWIDARALRIFALLDAGRYAEAQEDVDAIIEAGDETLGMTLRAVICMEQADFDGAQTAFDAVPDQNNPELLLYRAYSLLYIQDDAEAALTLLKRLQTEFEPFADTYRLSGDAYARQGSWTNAQQAFEKGCTLSKQDPASNYGLVLLQLRWGHLEDALRYLTQMEKECPGYYETMLARVYYENRNGQYERALECFDALLKKFPCQEESLAATHLVLLADAAKTAESLALLDTVLPVDSCDAFDWNDRAYVLLCAKQYEEAIDALAHGMETLTSPTLSAAEARIAHANLSVTRAEIAMAQQNIGDALTSLEDACAFGWYPVEASTSSHLAPLLGQTAFEAITARYPIE